MQVLRTGGEFIDGRIRLHGSKALIFYAAGLAVAGATIVLNLNLVGLLALAIVLFLFKESFLRWERWYKGRIGEAAVRGALQTLPDEYVRLDDIVLPHGRGNVDHFVAGPTGLFVIETKNYSGDVKCERDMWYVNRRKIASLSRQVKGNALAVRHTVETAMCGSEAQPPFIVPLLVFTNPNGKLKLFQPAVPVLRVEELVEFIRNYKFKTPVARNDMRAIVRHLISLQFSHAAPASV